MALCGFLSTPRLFIFNQNAQAVFSFFAFSFSGLNKAERSYFLSCKNNGGMLCSWVQFHRFGAVTKKQVHLTLKTEVVFHKTVALRLKYKPKLTLKTESAFQ